ncbi:hypothetical protein MWN34_16785 [Ancylobacter sp. 6x-1]|uniref:Uncharacterized protein n=1 Tax=Ancylobacter crimeensis TaxID=2579147 RepID=A0ABT0DFA6_9HYPH|nr:hypothetical protein [Ancylobacter crimeensis]MCK0198559.1 hypothetical protein [Ancylobacter crimeensis]
MKRRLAVSVCGLLVGLGVVRVWAGDIYATQQPADEGVKQIVLGELRKYSDDPTAVHNAEISGVVTLDAANHIRAVCVRFDTKGRDGAEAKGVLVSVKMQNSYTVGFMENAAGCRNAALNFAPFPEADTLPPK